MSTKSKAVGIYKGELFISPDGERVDRFDVIRPISAEKLEELHDIEYWKENYRYWWIDAARAGKTDESLDDYFQGLMDEEDNGDEEFIAKDSSDCDVFDYDDGELRRKCDAFILKDKGFEVGTWESAGCYHPMDWGQERKEDKYKRFDLVLDEELARKYYELRNLGEI